MSDLRRTRRVRRFASMLMLLCGTVTIVSALTPSFDSRIAIMEDLLPLWLHQAVFGLAVVTGVGLMLLATGVRHGQRRAWRVAVAVLTISGVAHLAKSLDVEEAVLAFVMVLFLVVARDEFRVASRPLPERARQATRLALTVTVGTGAAFVSVHVKRPRMPVGRAAWAVGERLVGVRTVALHGRLDRFSSPALAALGATTIAALAWLAMRPLRRPANAPLGPDAARAIVARHGDDSLAYFALRDDKQWWTRGDTLIAYTVVNRVCLVSPDPVGPEAEAEPAWRAFQAFVSDHGWSVAVLGAGARWLRRYEAYGLRSRYVGDEAIVDVRTFALGGKRMKGLRQAANRVATKGYTISFHDPAALDHPEQDAVRAVLSASRRGDVERGFSMTLSRLFDPADRDLLLAVCHAPDGAPVAFCQFVPAGAEGCSLDVMRRSTGDHPNGLTDFVLVRTIEHLRETGRSWLSLNFATMRAVLAGESSGRTRHVQRWLLERMSDSMQIESLWRYCAKFDPTWVPRYLVYDTAEHLLGVGFAVARAESFWELPVVGSWLRPAPRPDPVPLANGS